MNAVVRWLLAACLAAATPVASAQEAAPPGATPPIRVMFVGNSLTYANNMPRIVRAIAASQPSGPVIETATYALPGAELDDLWDDGHAAEALRGGDWDVVVLQELGGLTGCVRRSRQDAACRRSAAAHRHFIELARAGGARVLLLATWERTRGGSDWGTAAELRERKEAMTETYDQFRRWVQRGDDQVQVLPAAGALFDFAAGLPLAQVLSDGMHPTMASSTIIAAQLYAAITGRQPQAADLMIDFPLLPPAADVRPDRPMESQPQIAGDGSRYLVKADIVAPLYAVANKTPSR